MRGLIEGLENPHPILTTLPAVYHEDNFSERLTRAFDEVLAPVIATLDNLEAYVDPDLAPRDFVEWLAGWVGFPIGETWPEDRSRQLVAEAVELYRWRGTVRGVKELLRIYAGVEPEVIDSGGVSWSSTPGSAPPPAQEPSLRVRVRAKGRGGVDARQLEDLINSAKPAHVPHTLEVRG